MQPGKKFELKGKRLHEEIKWMGTKCSHVEVKGDAAK